MAIDIDKQVAYWRASAEEDWEVGRSLVKSAVPAMVREASSEYGDRLEGK